MRLLQGIHTIHVDVDFDPVNQDVLRKELSSAKLELESSKRHVLELTKKIKGLEIQHINAVRNWIVV